MGGFADENLRNLLLSFKAMGGGLWDYDIDRDILLCNRRWYEIMGLDPDVVKICSVADFRPYIHPDDVDFATMIDPAEIERILATDDRYAVDFRIVRPSGEMRWVRSVASLVENTDSGTRQAVGCVTDITEFMASEPQDPLPPLAEHTDEIAEGHVTGLSERERECLIWVSLGKTAWETARIIGRSPRTVEFHLKNATAKLGAANKVHAAALAIRQGLL